MKWAAKCTKQPCTIYYSAHPMCNCNSPAPAHVVNTCTLVHVSTWACLCMRPLARLSARLSTTCPPTSVWLSCSALLRSAFTGYSPTRSMLPTSSVTYTRSSLHLAMAEQEGERGSRAGKGMGKVEDEVTTQAWQLDTPAGRPLTGGVPLLTAPASRAALPGPASIMPELCCALPCIMQQRAATYFQNHTAPTLCKQVQRGAAPHCTTLHKHSAKP